MPEDEQKRAGGTGAWGAELLQGRGTRSTLRLGPFAAGGAPPTPGAASAAASLARVMLLPVRIGQHRLAIEVARVIEVTPGGAWTGALDPERPVVTADLYRAIGLLAPEDRETVLARADGKLGRGPGRFVAFAVDGADRLVQQPLETIAPLPAVVREQIQVDFLVGVVRLQFPDDGMAFLLDPKKLADSAGVDGSLAEVL